MQIQWKRQRTEQNNHKVCARYKAMVLLQETGFRAERMGGKKKKIEVEEKKDKDDRKANVLFPPTGQIPNVGVSTQNWWRVGWTRD